MEVETVLAIIETFLCFPSVDETLVVFACVGCPYDRGVRGGGPERGRERVGLDVVLWSSSSAATAWEGLASLEEELLGQELVIRAGAIDMVRHVVAEVDRELGARTANRGDHGVGIEVGVEAERELVGGSDGVKGTRGRGGVKDRGEK